MSRNSHKGFGLIEVMIAMVLGLVVILGVTQIFLSAKQTSFAQSASAKMQEDARYVLTRMAQELRVAGMFGCVLLSSVDDEPAAFNHPVSWNNGTKTLTIITSNVSSGSGVTSNADWTLITDCKSGGRVVGGNAAPTAANEMAFGIRQIEYQYDEDSKALKVQSGGAGGFQPLVSGVSAFTVSFGLAASATESYVSGNYESTAVAPSLIRSVRVEITLSDASGKVKDQSYSIAAALRNRIL